MNMQKLFPPDKLRSIPTIILIGLLLLYLTGCSKETAPISPEEQGKPAVNAAIAKYEPALAVRGSGCITCHASVNSAFITDFGHGDPYFFGMRSGGITVGPFNGNIYGDFIAEPGKTGWLTADFQKEIIVPRAALDIDPEDASDSGLNEQAPYRTALQATSLKNYLQVLESQKPNPASVIEKETVFIGAPDVATLETRFELPPGDTVSFKYLKNDPGSSPDFEGIELSENGNYHTNTSEVVCDGDLFLRGILFLNKASVATNSGCRIYTAGPVFVQGEIPFRNLNKGKDNSNLQIVSTEAIFLGVGQKSCKNTTGVSDPLNSRLLLTPALTSLVTRTADRDSIPPETFSQNLYDKAASVPLEDSSCHDETISLSRILLNAPIVHSRYSGNFKGVVIAEFALFWQGKSSYEFDPVFKEVPVLPILKEEDYLLVE